MSTAEAKKDQVLATLVGGRRQVMEELAALRPEVRQKVFLGEWSAREVLAHLVGWDDTNLAAGRELLAGQLPAFYAEHDRDWRSYNARLVATHGRLDWAELVAAAQESHRKLIEWLTALPAGEFGRDRGVRFRGYKVTVGRLLEAEAQDEVRHAEQLREFRAHDPAG